MPGHSHQQQTQPAVSTGGPSAQNQLAAGRGNAAAQEKLRSSQGKLTWQAALGDTLGGKLYDALADQLTDDKLLGHANRAVDSAMNALKAQLAGAVQPSDEEAAAMFVAHLDTSLKAIAQKAVVDSGLSEGVRDAVDAHPYEIALAAIAGAVAYVLSNQDLPLLEAKLGLGGGHSLVGGIDPGRTMSFALEQVRVGYRYQGGGLEAAVDVDRYQDGYGASGKIGYKPDADTEMALAGSYSDRDGVQKSKLDLSYMNRNMAAALGLERTEGGKKPGQAITGSLKSRGSDLQRSLSGTYRDDGSWEAAAGIGRTEKDRSWSIEAFGGQDAHGREDKGVRAMFKLRF